MVSIFILCKLNFTSFLIIYIFLGGAISCAIHEIVSKSTRNLDNKIKYVRYIAIDYLSPCKGEVILSVYDNGCSIDNNIDNKISSSLNIIIHNNVNSTSFDKNKTSKKNKLKILAQATVLMIE